MNYSKQCSEILVSIILPIHNGEKWIDDCIQSILGQTYKDRMELCVFDDASTDLTEICIRKYEIPLKNRNIDLIYIKDETQNVAKGCGYAKNQAVHSSSGDYLCFQDVDDTMHPERVEKQLKAAMNQPQPSLVGCKVSRKPLNSTVRYTNWINNLTHKQLQIQIYTANGPTVVMPTWFCHRKVFNLVGSFDEGGKGVPEDYIFFLKLINLKVNMYRCDDTLLTYLHHPLATTMSVSEDTIWGLRMVEIQKWVLSKWDKFTIWNAGKQGRRFYRDLNQDNKNKVLCFCDVDKNKIDKGFYVYEMSTSRAKPKIPILHFESAKKPFIICVKQDLTSGEFENNLKSLDLIEGEDYVYFS